MIRNAKYSQLLYYFLLLLLSIVFVSIFCEVSTPLTYRYVGDSSIFIALGRMFVDGLVPYHDFFDHKGPSLVLLQGLAQLIAPYRMGLFVLEVILFFLFFVVITRISDLVLDRKRNLILIFGFLVLFTRIIYKGNTNEEHSLLPLLLSMYIFCKYYFKERKIGWSDAFIIGVCFSFIFWLRLNNAGTIVAICVFLFITTLVDRDYQSFKRLILYFALGQLPFTVLYLGYFSYHGALDEMIYGTFLFNFKYVNNLFSTSGEAFEINYLLFVMLLVGAILDYRKRRDWRVILFAILLFFFSYLTVNIGYSFGHYYILMFPALIFGGVLILESITSARIINGLLVVFALVLSAFIIRAGYYVISESKYFKSEGKELYNNIHQVIDLIPEEERGRTYYYGINSNFYLWAEINANYKYFVLQDWHGRHDNAIFDEIDEMMNSENYPLWVMTENELTEENRTNYINQKFINQILDKYELRTHQNGYRLFKRKLNYD